MQIHIEPIDCNVPGQINRVTAVWDQYIKDSKVEICRGRAGRLTIAVEAIAVETIAVETIAVETIAVETIAVEMIAVEAIAVEVIALCADPGGVDQ